MTRIIAKLFAVVVVFTAFLPFASAYAAEVTYVSSTGNDSNPCTAALPCLTLFHASKQTAAGGQISCLDSPATPDFQFGLSVSLTIDCAGVYEAGVAGLAAFRVEGTNQVVKIRNLTISGGGGGYPAISATGSGTLILENCVFENFTASGAGPALDIEPTGALNLVVTNSRISNSAAGVLIQPGSGGSVTATFNGVTIADNTGGGMKTDTINGPVRVDISNSTVSNNSGNGLNAVSGAGGANMLNLKNDVIAGNGTAGVQANGTNAAALIDMTLLDSNASGALITINGGRLLTYGNNHIVGSAGSGFTGTAPSQ
jgi:hypothetical protein